MLKLAVVLCSILLASAHHDIFLEHIKTNKLMNINKIKHTVEKLNNISISLDDRTEEISQTIFNETYIIIKNIWRQHSEVFNMIKGTCNDLSVKLNLNCSDLAEKILDDTKHQIKKLMECVTQRYEYHFNGIKELKNLLNTIVSKINNSTENVQQEDYKNLNVKSTIDAILNSRAAASLVNLNAIPVFQRSDHLLQNLTDLSTLKSAITSCASYKIHEFSPNPNVVDIHLTIDDTQGHNVITKLSWEPMRYNFTNLPPSLLSDSVEKPILIGMQPHCNGSGSFLWSSEIQENQLPSELVPTLVSGGSACTFIISNITASSPSDLV